MLQCNILAFFFIFAMAQDPWTGATWCNMVQLGVSLSMKPWTSVRNGSKEFDPDLAATFHGQNLDRKSHGTEGETERNGEHWEHPQKNSMFFLVLFGDSVCKRYCKSLEVSHAVSSLCFFVPLSNGRKRSGTLHDHDMTARSISNFASSVARHFALWIQMAQVRFGPAETTSYASLFQVAVMPHLRLDKALDGSCTRSFTIERCK